MSTPFLMHLRPGEPLYNEVEKFFVEGWQDSSKTGTITDIFYVNYRGPEAQRHLANYSSYEQMIQSTIGQNLKATSYNFHGTQRACYIGENASSITPCQNPDCHLCSIIKCSFQIKYIGQSNALGPGFYTSSTSNKADGYAKNSHIHSQRHALLLGNVITGRKEYVHDFNPSKHGPMAGYHSVEAVPNNRTIRWPETVVYREDAIIPSCVIMYTRTGWTPNH